MSRQRQPRYSMSKIPINREDDGELLGYVTQETSGWSAQTMFGYVFARADSQAAVEEAVRSQGLQILQGVWQYYDKDDSAWYPCILKEAYPGRVTVIRTNAMGYQDPDDYKQVTITNPDETKLAKV